MSTQRKRLLMLGLGSLLAILLSYEFSLSKTWHEYELHGSLEALEHDAAEVERQLSELKTRSMQLDNGIGSWMEGGFEEGLLNAVGTYSELNGIGVERFSEPWKGERNGYAIETIEVRVVAGFSQLVGLLHHLEQEFSLGRVVSVSFERERDYRRNKDELYMKLFVQNIKPLQNVEKK